MWALGGLYFLFNHKALIILSNFLFSVLMGAHSDKYLLHLLFWKMIMKVLFILEHNVESSLTLWVIGTSFEFCCDLIFSSLLLLLIISDFFFIGISDYFLMLT